LETQFEKDYPFIKWEPKNLSQKFLIPIDKVKELINDKPGLIKLIYETKV